jgi:hypothetical protein
VSEIGVSQKSEIGVSPQFRHKYFFLSSDFVIPPFSMIAAPEFEAKVELVGADELVS